MGMVLLMVWIRKIAEMALRRVKMRLFAWLIVCLLGSVHAADYKSAQKMTAGDVVSADVLNDMFEQIEFNLSSADEKIFLGSWNITQTVRWQGGAPGCSGDSHDEEHEESEEEEHDEEHGGGSDCKGLASNNGFGAATDSLYRQRSDQVTFTDDGDGTFSLRTSDYCAFLVYGWGNNGSCSQRFAVFDNFFVSYSLNAGMEEEDDDLSKDGFFRIQKISDTRLLLSALMAGSTSYNVIRLDRVTSVPEPPSNLTATFDSGTVTLSWTENDSDFTAYSIRSKDKVDAGFTELSTSLSNSFIDEIESGTSRWYRVFATNSVGDSIGSNVIRISF